MTRQDWYYLQLRREQKRFFDEVVEKEGTKYGIYNSADLMRSILAKFQENYEIDKILVCAKNKI